MQQSMEEVRERRAELEELREVMHLHLHQGLALESCSFLRTTLTSTETSCQFFCQKLCTLLYTFNKTHQF